jgi:hypothetical protein
MVLSCRIHRRRASGTYNILANDALGSEYRIDAGGRMFATGPLANLIVALRRNRSGDLVPITGDEIRRRR